MRNSALVMIGTVGFILLASQLGIGAHADSGKVAKVAELLGSYTYVGDRAKDEASIKAKADAATAQMSRMVLKRAKPRLDSSTRIPNQLSITQQGANLVFKMDDYVVTTPKDGTSAKVTTPIGETADASFDTGTAMLLQSVATTGGAKRNTFGFDPSGQLLVHVQITNSRFVAPVAFTLLYARSQ